MVRPTHEQAEKIYRTILDQLEELWLISAEPGEASEEDDEGSRGDIQDVIAGLVEEGMERGLDEESVDKVFKAVAHLAEKAEEA